MSARPPHFALLALSLLLTLAGCASPAGESERDRVAAPSVAEAPTATAAAPTAAPPRGSARWETVVTLTGSGDAQTEAFSILPDALQWRVRFSCEGGGPFVLGTTPGPRRPGPIATGSCPGAEAFAIHTGELRLGVQAPAGWTAIVDQQVDSPLNEPLPTALADAVVQGQGDFYDLDMTGTGQARLYRTADGRRFLRLENFTTTTNTDLFVWLTNADRPPDSATAFAAERFVLGNLTSTMGNQNYEIPPEADLDIRSVVIWCAPVAIAYTAASLVGTA